MGQSYDFCRVYCLFVARVASFGPKLSEGANDATIIIIKPANNFFLQASHMLGQGQGLT